MEEQIDTEMKKMDELDDDDIEKIRQRRLKAMQKAHQAKQVCLGCKPFREKKMFGIEILVSSEPVFEQFGVLSQNF